MREVGKSNGVIFQPKCRINLRRLRRRSILGGYLVHDLVAPKIIDHCIACLDRMKGAAGWSRFEQGAQPHEPVASAARIKSVEGDQVTFVALERSTIGQSHCRNSALVT